MSTNSGQLSAQPVSYVFYIQMWGSLVWRIHEYRLKIGLHLLRPINTLNILRALKSASESGKLWRTCEDEYYKIRAATVYCLSDQSYETVVPLSDPLCCSSPIISFKLLVIQIAVSRGETFPRPNGFSTIASSSYRCCDNSCAESSNRPSSASALCWCDLTSRPLVAARWSISTSGDCGPAAPSLPR